MRSYLSHSHAVDKPDEGAPLAAEEGGERAENAPVQVEERHEETAPADVPAVEEAQGV